MPANVSVEYANAEKSYLASATEEEKLTALEEMIRFMPQHKAGEALRKNLRQRYKKLKEKLAKKEKQKKVSRKEGIKKSGIQVVLCGLTNSGKSSLLSYLTNAKPKIAEYQFTTKEPMIGTLNYQDISFQIIDMPAINHETFNQSLANNADILLIIITNLKELEEILPFLENAKGKKIIVVNKADLLNEEQKRKISSFLQTKKYDFIILSKTFENTQIKEKLLENSGIIRIYTKQPHKPADREPVILKPPAKIKDLAEKIFHKSVKIKQVRITGPSSKFPNQLVSLEHELKDKDVVEVYVE